MAVDVVVSRSERLDALTWARFHAVDQPEVGACDHFWLFGLTAAGGSQTKFDSGGFD